MQITSNLIDYFTVDKLKKVIKAFNDVLPSHLRLSGNKSDL